MLGKSSGHVEDANANRPTHTREPEISNTFGRLQAYQLWQLVYPCMAHPWWLLYGTCQEQCPAIMVRTCGDGDTHTSQGNVTIFDGEVSRKQYNRGCLPGRQIVPSLLYATKPVVFHPFCRAHVRKVDW